MRGFIPHKEKKHNWKTAVFIITVMAVSAGVSFFVHARAGKLNVKIFDTTIFHTDASILQTEPVGPNEAIEIVFSAPVDTSFSQKEISIFPESKMILKWEEGNRKLKIIPESYWSLETDYRIELKGRNIFFSRFEKSFEFSTHPWPEVLSTVPSDGAEDIAVNMEDPIIFNFSRPLDDFSIKFEVEPYTELEHLVSDDRTSVRLVSRDDFKWNTKYTISTYLKLKQQMTSQYRKAHDMFFESVPPPVIDRSLDQQTQLKQALLYTKPLVQEGKYIDINLKYQHLIIFENGKALDAFLVSTGKKGMETPQGTFAIHNKALRPWSKKYSLFMPYWMAIFPSGAVGIHELPEWPGGYKEGANHLGIPVSHGCIRLGVGPAKRVFDWANIGTPVIIHM